MPRAAASMGMRATPMAATVGMQRTVAVIAAVAMTMDTMKDMAIRRPAAMATRSLVMPMVVASMVMKATPMAATVGMQRTVAVIAAVAMTMDTMKERATRSLVMPMAVMSMGMRLVTLPKLGRMVASGPAVACSSCPRGYV